jgi:hypothetical protein
MSLDNAKLPWFGSLLGGGQGNPQEESPQSARHQQKPGMNQNDTSPLWGPYHSSDSEEEDEIRVTTVGKSTIDSSPTASRHKEAGSNNDSGGTPDTNPNQGGDSTSVSNVPQFGKQHTPLNNKATPVTLESLWEHAEAFWATPAETHVNRVNRWTEMAQDACASPCTARDLCYDLMEDEPPVLGITPLQGPNHQTTYIAGSSPSSVAVAGDLQPRGKLASLQMAETSTTTVDAKAMDTSFNQTTNPADRRRQRHEQRLQQQSNREMQQHRTHEEIEVSPNHHIQVRLPPQDLVPINSSKNKKKLPFDRKKAVDRMPVETLDVSVEEAAALERSISELTMRSSYATAIGNSKADLVFKAVPEKSRRMAYYAVGKHHRQAGRGGNRRCYFTGKLILGGAPFYAGSVQQGLRTLVVFCLPSALGLPDKETLIRYSREMEKSPTGSSRPRIGSSSSRTDTIMSVQPATREIAP